MALPRLVALVLFWIGRTADRAARLTHYLAAGALGLADLREGIRTGWQDHYRRDADNADRLMPWEQNLVDRFVGTAADVLIVGSGSGRDVVPLAERGCRVTGIEPSGVALATARSVLKERGLSATLVEGFFEDAPVSGTFDAVIFSYYCYSFMPESRRRIAALVKAAALLKPGGHVLVSHAHQSRPRLILIRLARLAGALCRSDWRVEPGDLVWDNRGPRPSYSYTHAFQTGEVEQEAVAAGLQPVFSCDTGDGRAVVLTRT